MSKKMNLAFLHKEEVETARDEMSKIHAGRESLLQSGDSPESICQYCDVVDAGSTLNAVKNCSPPTPKDPEPSCDCGWSLDTILTLWL